MGLFIVLFIFTFNRMYVEQVLEKTDWLVLYNQRTAIVEQVKNNELNPNVTWNDVLCELPFEFPVVSNGGNDIMIFRNDKAVTVKFWTYRNFFSAPSTSFIYTTDGDEIKGIEAKIKKEPNHNWKIEEHWYRVYEND